MLASLGENGMEINTYLNLNFPFLHIFKHNSKCWSSSLLIPRHILLYFFLFAFFLCSVGNIESGINCQIFRKPMRSSRWNKLGRDAKWIQRGTTSIEDRRGWHSMITKVLDQMGFRWDRWKIVPIRCVSLWMHYFQSP